MSDDRPGTLTKWTIIIALVILGKLSGLLKDVLLTFYHGVSSVTDAYFLSSSISSLVYMAVYAAVPVLVIPLYSRIKDRYSEEVVGRKILTANLIFTGISFLLTVSVYFLAPKLVDVLAVDVSESVRSKAIVYLQIMSFTFILSTIVALLNAVQSVEKRLVPSYMVAIVNNSLFCVGIFFFNGGAEFNSVLYLGIIAWLFLAISNQYVIRDKIVLLPRWSFDFIHSPKFLLLLAPALMAFYIEYANNFVGVYFAAVLESGSISVLAYANKLNLILLSVFLVVLTTSIFPKVALATVREDVDEITDFLSQIVRIIVVVGAPAIVFVFYFSDRIVSLLFERGEFSHDHVVEVSVIFSIVLTGLPFALIRDIMNRVYFSYNNTSIPALVMLSAFLLNVLLSYLFHEEFGLRGIALAIIGSTALNALAMMALVRRRVGQSISVGLIRTLVSAGIAVYCASLILDWAPSSFDGFWMLLFAPFALTYFGLLYAVRLEEALAVTGFVKNLVGRR